MLVAMIIIIITSIPLIFLPNKDPVRNIVYPLAAIQSVGLAIQLNCATSLISDVIGKDNKNSAFVYGFYSLLDKFLNGTILLYLVAKYPDNDIALKYIMGLTPIICSIATFYLSKFGQRYF